MYRLLNVWVYVVSIYQQLSVHLWVVILVRHMCIVISVKKFMQVYRMYICIGAALQT